jgi:hypothetical protein
MDAGFVPDAGANGQATVNGSVQGFTLNAGGAINESTFGTGIAIGMSPNLCTELTQSNIPSNDTFLYLNLFQTGASGTPIIPTMGTFAATLAYNEPDAGPAPPNTQWVVAAFSADGAAACETDALAYASGGSVELTSFALGSTATGSFNLSFGSDSLSGTFTAPFCSTFGSNSPCP